MAHIISESSRMFQNVPERSRMFQNVPECSRMFRNVPECSRMFRNVPECSGMFQIVPGYSRMFRMFHNFKQNHTFLKIRLLSKVPGMHYIERESSAYPFEIIEIFLSGGKNVEKSKIFLWKFFIYHINCAQKLI